MTRPNGYSDLIQLRDTHALIDMTASLANGWTDLAPRTGHDPTEIGIRWTFSLEVRFEILTASHRRYSAEKQAGRLATSHKSVPGSAYGR